MDGFCSQGESLSVPWLPDKGISRCFLQTVGSSVAASWLLLIGTIQIIASRKKLAKTMWRRSLPGKTWIKVQLAIPILMCLSNVIDVVLDFVLTNPRSIHGYLILSKTLYAVAWLFTVVLLVHERNRVTPLRRRHGVALLGFYGIALIFSLLAFAGWSNRAWFWLHVFEYDRDGGYGSYRVHLIDAVLYCVDLVGLVVAFLMALASPTYRVAARKAMMSVNADEEANNEDVEATKKDATPTVR